MGEEERKELRYTRKYSTRATQGLESETGEPLESGKVHNSERTARLRDTTEWIDKEKPLKQGTGV